MLAEKHDIDQLFQDRLEDYEVNPPIYLWKNIEDGLNNRKRAHRLALIKGLSIAAAVVLAFVAGWMFTQPHQEQVTKEVVVVPQNDSGIRQEQINSDVNASISRANANHVPVKMNARVASVQPVKLSNRAGIGNDNTVQVNQSAVFAVAERRKDETLSMLSARLPSINTANNPGLSGKNENWIRFLSKCLGLNNNDAPHLTISEQELRDRRMIASNIQEYAKKDKTVKRWKLAAEASPLFSGVSSSGDHNDYMYAANALSNSSPAPSTTTEPTLSGGVMFGYKLNKRLSVKSGIVYSKIRHNTNHVSVFGGNNSTYAIAGTDYGVNSKSTTYAANTEVGLVKFGRPPGSIKDGAYLAVNMSNSELSSTTAYASNADLKQNLEYIAIPVLVAYHLIDRKVNVDLTGGMSTNILVGNNASLYEGGVKTQGGETSQLRDLVYAGTVGLGLGYDLSKRVTVTLEPRVKYYLNSISTSNHINYRPYQLGIYTGVTYAFN
ncbi:outer membrane beta-barrel protein [Prolixibacter sp. SD074]|uniref:outer membrane beta-barrel protein n=1 Tax=Prolixibacter sp. SD074 TaxID=2652391 RepID=UPI00128868FA|nr:outer membrane beta-barrel protein [Prolixibacter sp. SD074]GET30002.1 hypothetical protein SD074_22040 [Prolixibacter sp. SD074]